MKGRVYLTDDRTVWYIGKVDITEGGFLVPVIHRIDGLGQLRAARFVDT